LDHLLHGTSGSSGSGVEAPTIQVAAAAAGGSSSGGDADGAPAVSEAVPHAAVPAVGVASSTSSLGSKPASEDGSAGAGRPVPGVTVEGRVRTRYFGPRALKALSGVGLGMNGPDFIDLGYAVLVAVSRCF